MSRRTAVPVLAAVLALAMLPAPPEAPAARASAFTGQSSSTAGTSLPALTVDVDPVTTGSRSAWIRVETTGTARGELTVTAPAGTRIVDAEADVRPLTGEVSADGSTAHWSGPTTTWSSDWRVATFRLVVDADARPGSLGGGRLSVTGATGAEVATGEFAVPAVAGLDAATPSARLGQTTDWVRIVPTQTVQGELTVTAPRGTRIVAADADVRPVPGAVDADGARAHWAGPTTTWATGWRVPKVKLESVASAAGARTPGTLRVDAADGTPRALGTLDFIPTGAIPASIVRSADGSSSDVRVYGIGRAEYEQARENRSMRHSDLQPTGRFVRVGDVVEVSVPADAPATGVRIGLYGDAHQGVATSGWQALTPTPAGRTTTVTATKDGMVFLESTAPSGTAVVRVTGGMPVPTFVLGQTTDADFAAQVEAMPDAPLFELVGNRIFGDFQRRVLDAVPADLGERVQLWDDVVELTNDMHSLSDTATGTARKAPHRMYIASPDDGAGYANANHERIMFQVSTGAARDLLRDPIQKLWGFWHEVGHTYQTPSYNWGGQGEVAVNVSSLYVENRFGLPSSIATPGKLGVLRQYFAQPVDERSYQSADIWVRLVMYDQLRRAFGNEFYPQLNQEFRTAKALGEPGGSTSAELQDRFALTAARTADRDLTEFFRQWGLPVSPSTEAAMARLPALSVPIWEDLDAGSARVEHTLPRIGVPDGSVHTDETVVVGQRELRRSPEVRDLRSPDGGDVTVGADVVSALDPGTAAGTVSVEVTDGRGLREALRGTVDVSAGNSIQILGQANRTVMWLSLVPGTRELRLVPRTTYQAHSSWAGREYVSLELRSPDDTESLGSWSLRGDETAHPLGARFDEHYRDGQILTVRHAQDDGIRPYTDGAPVTVSRQLEQRFRIEGDRLVRLGAVVALPGPDTTLARGATTDVEAGLAFLQDTAGATGTVAFTAPEGTTFDRSIGRELLGSYRDAEGSWSGPTEHARLTDVVRSADGTQVTASFRFTEDGDRGYDAGDRLRWHLPVTVARDAAAGSSSMDARFRGTTL